MPVSDKHRANTAQTVDEHDAYYVKDMILSSPCLIVKSGLHHSKSLLSIERIRSNRCMYVQCSCLRASFDKLTIVEAGNGETEYLLLLLSLSSLLKRRLQMNLVAS